MASFDPLHLSRRQQGLPPLTLGEVSSIGDTVPSLQEQSPMLNPYFHIAPCYRSVMYEIVRINIEEKIKTTLEAGI